MTEPERLDSFELPAPTVWPKVVALGVTLGFTGLVTHVAVSVVGVVLALVGGVGWWRNVLPEERVEHVPVSPAQRDTTRYGSSKALSTDSAWPVNSSSAA